MLLVYADQKSRPFLAGVRFFLSIEIDNKGMKKIRREIGREREGRE